MYKHSTHTHTPPQAQHNGGQNKHQHPVPALHLLTSKTHPHNLMSPTRREQTSPLKTAGYRAATATVETSLEKNNHVCATLLPALEHPQFPHTLANAHSNPSNKMPACVLPGIYASCRETALLTPPGPVSSHHPGQLCTQLRRACEEPRNVFVEGRASPVL